MLRTILNAHGLFCGSPDDRPFLDRLNLPRARIITLRTSRDKIRAQLTAGFSHWQDFGDPRSVLENYKPGTVLPRLRPKFRRQGSYAYGTLNAPAHVGQQVDFDDGVFLPVSFFQDRAGRNVQSPFLSSHGYFTLVEAMLGPLCKDEGWTLVRKDSCVRVEVDKYSHIDLALYAIPDSEFAMLIEKAAFADRLYAMDAAAGTRTYDRLGKSLYRQLEAGTIMLAQREEGWIESDPRKLEDWFVAAINDHGEQLRRVCRFFKAWRDYMWERGCKLNSITVMKCVVDAYDALKGSFDQSRDDAAILMVAGRLPNCFREVKGISNPVIDTPLNGNWSPEQRADYVARAERLHRAVTEAIQSTSSPAEALRLITEMFGPRIPSDPDLICGVAAERLIQSFQVRRTEAPRVTRTTSG